LKIRIFALAKEMNLDSKELIEACAKVGIILKNSALASISPEERDKVVEFLKQASSPAAPSARSTAPAAPVAPVRDVPRAVGAKVPELKAVAPRPQSPQTSRLGSGDKGGAATAVAELPATSTEVQPEPVAAPEFEAPEAERPVVAEPVAEPIAEQISAEAAAPALEVEAETAAEAVPAVEEAPRVAEPVASGEAPPTGGPTRPAALRPEDYIPASGTRRTMVPRESIELAPRGAPRKPKAKPGPALPTLTNLGKFKGPVAKAVAPEAPAQKPVQKLPSDLMTSPRPLHDILKKNAEKKEKKKGVVLEITPELAEEGPAKPGRPGVKQGGAGLNTSRKERQARRGRVGGEEEATEATPEVKIRTAKRSRRMTSSPQLKTVAQIEPPITVRSLSEALGRPANLLIKSLFVGKGMQVTMNSSLDEETALELALECSVDLEIRHARDIESELQAKLESNETAENLQDRPPIITILGHVDHGKTTLLDKIRSANVAGGEAGGITQHIAAYQVEHKGHKLTFVDTPGHAAFGEMRARGANVTDIVVLVVAADDGVMPQTVEAISHAKVAGVPMVVALNKIDLPGRNEQKVLQELSTNGVLPVEWGGDTEIVRTSGATGKGLDDLLETLLVTAELHELKADPTAPASGVCLEAFRDEGKGPLAWLIVQKGTLRIGDVVLCGQAHGRIRALYTDQNREVSEAGPSMPIVVSGFDIVPNPGDLFMVLPGVEEARLAADERRQRGRTKVLSERGKPRTLEDILDPTKAVGSRDLPLIIKADTPGSIEAIRYELGKFSHPEVRVDIIHQGVGGVNESDVYLAAAAGAIIVAFHVVPEDRARQLAEREGVEIRQYSIIYEVTGHIKQALEGLLRPELQHISTGRALVLKTFAISRFGTIAGCRVLNGTIDRSNRVRLIRDQRILNDYPIASLKREKDDVKEVREGMECGIRLEGFNDIKEGDLLESFRVEEIKRTL
jgi:translation initiation factor IF-2